MSEKEKKGAGAGAQVAPAMGPPGLIAKEDIPAVLPILPLRNSVFFPGGVLPLAVGRQKTIALLKDAGRDEQVIGGVTQRRAEEEDVLAREHGRFDVLLTDMVMPQVSGPEAAARDGTVTRNLQHVAEQGAFFLAQVDDHIG